MTISEKTEPAVPLRCNSSSQFFSCFVTLLCEQSIHPLPKEIGSLVSNFHVPNINHSCRCDLKLRRFLVLSTLGDFSPLEKEVDWDSVICICHCFSPTAVQDMLTLPGLPCWLHTKLLDTARDGIISVFRTQSSLRSCSTVTGMTKMPAIVNAPVFFFWNGTCRSVCWSVLPYRAVGALIQWLRYLSRAAVTARPSKCQFSQRHQTSITGASPSQRHSRAEAVSLNH